MVDYTKLIEQAAAEGIDYNETVSGGGGGDYVPPAEGMARLRFTEYLEIGEHMDGKKGEEKRKKLAKLKFELSGPKHPAKEVGEGESKRLIPHTITLTLPISQNEKSHYSKLFRRMNYDGTAKIFPQMLGNDFLGTVNHRIVGEGDKKRTYANLRDENGYTIRSPFVEDPESGEQRRVAADPVIGPVRCFLWDYVSQEAWDALFIDGRYDDKKDEAGNVIQPGRSKNWIQELIKSALNFEGSPTHTLIAGGDSLNDIGEVEKPARSEEAVQASAAAKVASNDENDPLAAVAA